jgi:dihydroorotate dehydrogenase
MDKNCGKTEGIKGEENHSSSLKDLQNTLRCNIQVIHDTKNEKSINDIDESISKSTSLRQALGINISYNS